jgi:hypothetical protein
VVFTNKCPISRHHGGVPNLSLSVLPQGYNVVDYESDGNSASPCLRASTARRRGQSHCMLLGDLSQCRHHSAWNLALVELSGKPWASSASGKIARSRAHRHKRAEGPAPATGRMRKVAPCGLCGSGHPAVFLRVIALHCPLFPETGIINKETLAREGRGHLLINSWGQLVWSARSWRTPSGPEGSMPPGCTWVSQSPSPANPAGVPNCLITPDISRGRQGEPSRV